MLTKLLHRDRQVCGVETTLSVQYRSQTVVVTTGTFLYGLMHIGLNQQSGGRAGEAAATGLSASLREVGLELGRLKTGTPPRLLRRSIDFSKTEIQPGDEPVPYFTHWKEDLFHVEHPPRQLPRRFHVEHSAKTGDRRPFGPVSGGPAARQYPPGSVLDTLQRPAPLPYHLYHRGHRLHHPRKTAQVPPLFRHHPGSRPTLLPLHRR